jgi:ATP-dependent DNA ligase
MGAVVEPISLDDERWVYEPKYDGIRVKVAVVPGSIDRGVEIWSWQGNLMNGPSSRTRTGARRLPP